MSSWKCHHHCCSIMSCIYCSAVLHLPVHTSTSGISLSVPSGIFKVHSPATAGIGISGAWAGGWFSPAILFQLSWLLLVVLLTCLIAIMWVPGRAVDLMGKSTCYDLWRLCYSLALQQQCEYLTGQLWTQYRMQSNRKLCTIVLITILSLPTFSV